VQRARGRLTAQTWGVLREAPPQHEFSYAQRADKRLKAITTCQVQVKTSTFSQWLVLNEAEAISMRRAPLVSLIFPILLAACASEIQNPLVGGFFADPGKYEFHSCEQLLPQRTFYAQRQQELKLLMDRAKQSTGGAVINVVAYQGEYTAVQEELNVIDATARLKKCKTPEDWQSSSAIR